jgi:hypothetical protein
MSAPASNMSTRSFCEEVAANKEKMPDPLTAFAQGFSPANIIKGLLGPLTSENEAESIMANKVEQNMDASTRQSFRSECSNAATAQNSNFIDTTACAKALGCEKLATPGLSDRQVDAMSRMCTFSNITQTNSNTVRQNCNLDIAIKALKGAELDSKLMAVMEKMQEAKGLMAKNSGKSRSCNDISTNVNASTYVESFKACASNFQTENSNFSSVRQHGQPAEHQRLLPGLHGLQQHLRRIDDQGQPDSQLAGHDQPARRRHPVAACLAVLCCCMIVGLVAYLMVAG